MKILIYNTIQQITLLVALFCSTAMWGQDKLLFHQLQQELNPLLEKIYSAPTDNERYNANEQFVDIMHEALHQENSFFYEWQFGKRVSVLTSTDKQFRIITWPVVRDDGEYECFGFIQSWSEKEGDYVVFTLHDKSDEMISAEETVLDPDNWYGCVYQDLVEQKFEGKMYYTLIGWTGVDALTQRKVIEPIAFKGTNAQPLFGQSIFRREKNRRRLILQYSATAMVNVRYEEQFVDVETVKKVKKKGGRTVTQREVHQEKMKMILFDEIAPQIPGMEGLYQYYIQTGTEMAYIFVNGRWELHNSAQGRVNNPKLNKEFEPLPKTAPTYKVTLRETDPANNPKK